MRRLRIGPVHPQRYLAALLLLAVDVDMFIDRAAVDRRGLAEVSS
jgi:hypothetical protein